MQKQRYGNTNKLTLRYAGAEIVQIHHLQIPSSFLDFRIQETLKLSPGYSGRNYQHSDSQPASEDPVGRIEIVSAMRSVDIYKICTIISYEEWWFTLPYQLLIKPNRV